MSIIETIQKLVQNDIQLARLFERVKECAELYLNAKQRQKGCDGMGEVAMLKDDCIYYMEKMIRYCKEKGYLSEDTSYEIDSVVSAIYRT